MSEPTGQVAVSEPPVAERFYGGKDWLVAGITAAVAFGVYFFTLAPSVTLEDSGELITAAYWLGVPHPPGYPLWTMLAWLWSHLLPVGNIAWRINLFSAVCSALAAGGVTLLVARSGRDLVDGMGLLRVLVERSAESVIVSASALAAGLLLAFSPVMWSQAVIAEVYGLNALLLVATLLVMYRWSFAPAQWWRLVLAAGLWGLSLTAHQTSVLLVVAWPLFVWRVDRQLGRVLLAPILAVGAGGAVWVVAGGPGLFTAVMCLAVAVGVVAWLYWLWREGPGWGNRWGVALAIYGAVLVGLAVYLYLPLAAAANPPMNWGATHTLPGFVRHFLRGQYAPVQTERSLLLLWGQFNMFFNDLQGQFNVAYALVALVTVFFFRELADRERNWLTFLVVAFLFLGFGFLLLSNPSFEKQKQFTERIFFLSAHCLYAMWIGYGLILGIGVLWTRQPAWQVVAWPAAVVVALLPVGSLWRNWADSEQRGHDFGYRFGYRMFQPGGGYPEMERNAVLFGGTDPGRFVPTYLVFVESQVPPRDRTRAAGCPGSETFDRRDVAIITQNALADSTYREVLRDQYGPERPAELAEGYPPEPITIPSEAEAQAVLRAYLAEFRQRQPLPGEDVQEDKEGRVRVQGLAGVMALNGSLTRLLFERNKNRHAFYLEESYSLPWMYPYLEPYGLILKLNKEPLPEVTAVMAARDRAYWDALARELQSDARFRRDDLAQQTVAKLRTAGGGVYAFRRMTAEAEYAFRQALALAPDNPDATFRLAELYAQLERFDDSLAVLERYRQLNPYDSKTPEAVRAIQLMQQRGAELQRLEGESAEQPRNFALTLNLARAYGRYRRLDALDQLVNRLCELGDLTVGELLQVAQVYADQREMERLLVVMTRLLQRQPQNGLGWCTVAWVYCVRNDCVSCAVALERALALDSARTQIRQWIQQDSRLDNCRSDAAFTSLRTQLDRKR